MELLDTIVSLLDRELIIQRIHTPIENGFRELKLEIHEKLDHGIFNKVLSLMIKHLYHYFPIRKELADFEALQEGIWLLEKYYKGEYTFGYDGALFDTINQEPLGIDYIVTKIAELVKLNEEEKYVSWILLSHISPLDWSLKKQLTEEFLDRFRNLLPQELLHYSSSRLTPHLSQLILTVVNADHSFKTILQNQNFSYRN